MKKDYAFILGLFITANVIGQIPTAINGLKPSNGHLPIGHSELIFEKSRDFPNQTQLSLAIIKQGETSFYGIKRTDDTILFTNNSRRIFEIGSLSKVFTSTLLANFLADQQMNLDDPIQDYFDFPVRSGDRITLKELANHTSGLPRLPSNLNLFTVDPANPYKDYDRLQLKEFLTENLTLNQEPGTHYEYSNLGAGLLGYILEKQTNSTYEELLQQYIFSKYDMSSSSANIGSIKENLVCGLDPAGNDTPNWDFNVLVGAGGIFSNVEDLAHFAIAQFDKNNRELELTRQPGFTINENMAIGLGWHLIQTAANKHWVWHNGGTGGYASSMALDIENRNGVIILSNVSAFNKYMGNIDQLCFELMKTLYP